MPNWCSGNVNFFGDVSAQKKLSNQIKKAISETGTFQGIDLHKLADLEESFGDYYFDCEVIYEPDPQCVSPSLQFQFATKWSPKPNTLVAIAKKFNLEFRYSYEELGNGIYGAYVFQEGSLMEFNLDDPNRFQDEDGDFDYESADEALEELIEGV